MEMTDPHRFLGLQDGGKCIRLLGEGEVWVQGKKVSLKKNEEGSYEYISKSPLQPKDYTVKHASGLVAHDPYAFSPTFSTEDEKLFAQGNHLSIDEVMGGRLCTHEGVEGVKFAVWAPCARGVF